MKKKINKLRKSLIKYEIFFSITSSVGLAIMAIIVSYYSYRVGQQQLEIYEYESKPSFFTSLERVSDDSLHFKIKYDNQKIYNLTIHATVVYNIEKRYITKSKNVSITHHSFKKGKVFYYDYNVYDNVVIAKIPTNFEYQNLKFLTSYYDNEHDKENIKLSISRTVFFEIEYNYLNNRYTNLQKIQFDYFKQNSRIFYKSNTGWFCGEFQHTDDGDNRRTRLYSGIKQFPVQIEYNPTTFKKSIKKRIETLNTILDE